MLQHDDGDNGKVGVLRNKKMKSKKKRNKEKRQERLLKYQEKLVQTSGLPPSRLMQQNRARLDDVKRSLQEEFDHLGSPAAATAPAALAEHVQAPPAPPVVQGNGYSSSSIFPMLCSISQPWAGGPTGGVTSTPSTGWPEARPAFGLESSMSQSPHIYSGSSSGLSNQLSLSFSPQYGMGLHVPLLFQPQPSPVVPPTPGGRPAYCFHCLQYGSVFSITPV